MAGLFASLLLPDFLSIQVLKHLLNSVSILVGFSMDAKEDAAFAQFRVPPFPFC